MLQRVLAIAILSVCPSVCLSVRLSVTRVDQAKTLQARIIKSSPSAAPRTVVSGSVTLFQKLTTGHPNRGLTLVNGVSGKRRHGNESYPTLKLDAETSIFAFITLHNA